MRNVYKKETFIFDKIEEESASIFSSHNDNIKFVLGKPAEMRESAS